MKHEMTLEAALKGVRAHGMRVQDKPIKLRKPEVQHVEDVLNRNGGRCVLVHNGRRMSVFSLAGYHGRKAGAAIATAAKKAKRDAVAQSVAA